ncbi:MAG TPA: aminotransferase class I/II-fold pyridoxal phosphate-dependent enzyme [bacterium]|nr:aminotransferase class I/II-fold pyridoxal phosphate-dependent enzyme [bacterium]HPM45671.1 aminotransferase class I/II-fold pyridoxal phosphate-dependent enzyme [bacterium]HRQ70403.1 aminotransferase class I/II-fold pyridoxal phosphate-dependent enzyme [bacterium]
MRNLKIFRKIDDYDRVSLARKNGIYPYFREIMSEQDCEVMLRESGRVIMLGSNSYLGLQSHPEVKEAAIKAIEKYGTGCAGSPFLNGTLDIHKELEHELADFVGKEDAVLFATGFMANLGTISTIVSRHDCILMDKYDHASLIDAAELSYGKIVKFKHNDCRDLEAKLSYVDGKWGKLIAVEGVFSMDGDIANLAEITEIAEKYECAVMVDDAHGIGVMGKSGRGTADYFGLTDKVDIIMGTFSKSLASIGGFVASDAQTIDFLRHHSRSVIFSASATPASTASVLASLKIIRREPERIEKLWENTRYMKNKLKEAGFKTGKSETPIIPILVGEDETTFVLCKNLEKDGVFVNPVISPAVAKGSALLRVSLMATHTFDQIDFSIDMMKKNFNKMGLLHDN